MVGVSHFPKDLMPDKSIRSFLQVLFLLLSLEFMQPKLILVLVQELVVELATELVKVLGYLDHVALRHWIFQTMTRLVIEFKPLTELHLQS